MMKARVVSIIDRGTWFSWTVYWGTPMTKKEGSTHTFADAWNAVSAIVEPEPQPHAYPLAGKLVAEAG